MLKIILLSLAAIVLICLVVVTLQPADFRITRSATFDAPAPAVFAQINDLHRWNEWSPWAKMDLNATNTFSGPEAGPGASMTWAGNNQVGEGRMTITDTKPGELIRMKLEFIKPFAATNTTEFMLVPEGDQTRLTWSMSGHNNFMGKAVGLFMNCDKMIGGQFEQGLDNLKTALTARKAT